MTMTANGTTAPRAEQRLRRRVMIGAIVVAGVLLLALANAHLVYVAVTSQPECVPHPTATDETPGSFRAAKPAC